MATPIGHITVTLYDDGSTGIDVEKVHYVQLYGFAAVLHEMARQSHAMDALAQGQKERKIEVVRGQMPT